MSSSSDENQAYINYYFRRRYFNHVIIYCESKLKSSFSDHHLIFWKAIALILSGNPTHAIQDLGSVEDKRDFSIIWHQAMIYAHKRCKFVDTEAVAALEAKFTISMVNPNISEKSFHIAGLFYLHTGQKDQAITHFRQSLSKNASFVPTMIGLGWAELQDSDTTSMFAEAMVISMRDIESILGQSMLLRKQRKSSQALDLINRLIAYSPNFIPALVERMYILLEMLSWDSLLESAQRLIGISHEDVDALTMISWFELCCEGPSENALTYLAISRKALEKLEPNNGDAMLNLCKPFARLSNRNPKILNECELMLQNSLRWNPNEPKYYIELGNLGLLQGEHSKAKESFEKASKLDPKNIEALEGIISWMIATKQYTAAEHQLEMFTELQKSLGLSASISFMNAQMSLKHLNSPETWLGCLKDALQTQLATIHGKTISLDYYVSFNPQFILTVIQNFMDNVTWSCLQENEIDRFQRILKEILEIVLRISPGSTESLYFLAKTVLMLGDSATAEIHLQKAISKSKTDLKLYLLLTEVHLGSKNYKAALLALEMALSFDFSIRQDPIFLLIKAKCLNGNEQFNEALTVLKTAFNLQSVKDAIKAIENGKIIHTGPSKTQIAEMYLNLVDCQVGSENQIDAVNTMSAALKLFQGTEVESLFILANAKVLLKKNDSKKALDLLSGIKPSQSGYLQARLLMADTYLHVEKNRKKYTMCFKEVVEKKPTVESCLLLGEAFLNIQEPLEAIAVYRSALKTYPDQSEFISKIGSAFVMTHDYEKALAYYKTAVEDSPNDSKSALWYDFASLLVRIKRYDQAIQEINKAINFSTQKKPCLLDAKLKMLLGDSMAKLTQYGQALSIYKNARELLQRLLSKELGNDAKIIEMEIVKTCIRIGALEEIKSKSFDEAGFLYTEALRLSPENEEAAIALTKLYINQGNTSAAQAQLNTLLEINPGSETASVIMGDLMFRNASFPAALYHYRQIFEKNKTNYEVLAKMVEISTRICKIDGIAQYFVVSKATKNTNISIGYHFCYGLYLRATSSYNDTMKEFALCRRDPVWGERSLLQLVEMLLNPSENTIGGDALEVAARISQQARSSSILEEVATAERLIQVATIFIQEIQEPKSLRTRILECHVLMATKQKAGIEQALKIMMDILNLHPDYIPAIYGTSVAFMLLKQSSKARNQLKRMSEVEWNNDFGPEIEKSWILLADIYIQDGKYDLATALLKRVTGVNQSCVKAWEYLGLIMEKEQSFKDAADYYFKCWNLQRRSNPPIGFKLAFNYLKAKRYTDAIDICHEVLAVSPDYPKIKIEILDKSRSLLR